MTEKIKTNYKERYSNARQNQSGIAVSSSTLFQKVSGFYKIQRGHFKFNSQVIPWKSGCKYSFFLAINTSFILDSYPPPKKCIETYWNLLENLPIST